MSSQLLTHIVKKSYQHDSFALFDPTLVQATPDLTNQLQAESLVWYDPAANYLKPLTQAAGTGATAYFYGVNMDQCPANFGSVDFPQGVTPNAARNMSRVSRGAQVTLKATASDFIVPNKAIYAHASDAQGMTTTSFGTSIGFVDPEQPSVASATAGQLILCQVQANWPTTAI